MSPPLKNSCNINLQQPYHATGFVFVCVSFKLAEVWSRKQELSRGFLTSNVTSNEILVAKALLFNWARSHVNPPLKWLAPHTERWNFHLFPPLQLLTFSVSVASLSVCAASPSLSLLSSSWKRYGQRSQVRGSRRRKMGGEARRRCFPPHRERTAEVRAVTRQSSAYRAAWYIAIMWVRDEVFISSFHHTS